MTDPRTGDSLVSVRDLAKAFPDQSTPEHLPVVAVDGFDLEVPRGAMLTILGPSGCGKTTTLRCIAGLERPDRGEITIDDRTVVSVPEGRFVPPRDRRLGMVFQSYAIWPHMTVAENVSFPLVVRPRRRRPDRGTIRTRVQDVLRMVRLDGLEQRPATKLSGGQQQRLALARALVIEPALLLLDEPLSNLDAQLRENMRFELKRLQRDLGITTIYVTHDQVEALALSTHIAVMNHGRVEQVGTPREVYETPASTFVARFLGASNFLEGTVEERTGSGLRVATVIGSLQTTAAIEHEVSTTITVAVRPEHVELSDPPGDGEPRGTVRDQAFLGDVVDHVVEVGSTTLRVRTPQRGAVRAGREVGLHVESGKPVALEALS